MFDLGWSELLLVAAVALLVIGPKDLPVAMRAVGKWVGKARAMTRHVRAGFDEMVRQAELEEMEKEWQRHNAAIMAGTAIPATGALPDLGAPFPPSPAEAPAEAPAGTPAEAPAGASPGTAGPEAGSEPSLVGLGAPPADPPASPAPPGAEPAR